MQWQRPFLWQVASWNHCRKRKWLRMKQKPQPRWSRPKAEAAWQRRKEKCCPKSPEIAPEQRRLRRRSPRLQTHHPNMCLQQKLRQVRLKQVPDRRFLLPIRQQRRRFRCPPRRPTFRGWLARIQRFRWQIRRPSQLTRCRIPRCRFRVQRRFRPMWCRIRL